MKITGVRHSACLVGHVDPKNLGIFAESQRIFYRILRNSRLYKYFLWLSLASDFESIYEIGIF